MRQMLIETPKAVRSVLISNTQTAQIPSSNLEITKLRHVMVISKNVRYVPETIPVMIVNVFLALFT